MITLVTGDRHTGKTHLAHALKTAHEKAIVIDDFDLTHRLCDSDTTALMQSVGEVIVVTETAQTMNVIVHLHAKGFAVDRVIAIMSMTSPLDWGIDGTGPSPAKKFHRDNRAQ